MIRDISRDTAIPETFLSKIFQTLATKGLIRSRRGFRAGFRLARPAERITLREIVEALQGPIEYHQGLEHLRGRGARPRCHLRPVVGQVLEKVASILEQEKLADDLCALL